MTRLRIPACLAAIALLFALPASASEDSGDAVARLGNTAFDAAALSSFVRALDPKLRQQALSDPALMNRLIGLELARIAVLNEAAAKKWQDRPEIARQIQRARDDAVFASYMASAAALPKSYPSEAEIASAYDMNRDAFLTPRQYRLEQIFIALPADKTAANAAEAKAKEIARTAKARVADFAELARTRSDHKASAAKGGDLGWATQTEIVAEIRDTVIGMEVGEVSEPIRSAAGWHIVRLADTKPAGPRPLAEVKDQLIQMLRQKKLQENEQAYLARLLEKSPVAVNQARLKKLFEAPP